MMNFVMTLNFQELEKSLITARIQELADRSRRSVLALCTATNPDATLSDRLASTRTALNQWQPGSVRYINVVQQVPELVALLETA